VSPNAWRSALILAALMLCVYAALIAFAIYHC
jgi:hypothetical protein